MTKDKMTFDRMLINKTTWQITYDKMIVNTITADTVTITKWPLTKWLYTNAYMLTDEFLKIAFIKKELKVSAKKLCRHELLIKKIRKI